MKLMFALTALTPTLLDRQKASCLWAVDRCREAGASYDCLFYGEADSPAPTWAPPGCGETIWDRAWSLSADQAAEHLAQLCRDGQYDGVLVFKGGLFNEIAVLTAQKLGWSYGTSVCGFDLCTDGVRIHRFAYNHNIEASLRLPAGPFVLGCDTLPDGEEEPCPAPDNLRCWPENGLPSYILNQTLESPRIETQAGEVLIVAGSGIQSRGDVDVIRTFARENGYQFGVSRPVAMCGWGKLHEIVGVSGGIYSPKICLTLGVSGAAAFYAGITNSKLIAAVNQDPNAKIHQLADVSIVDDYANVWERLFARLKREV